MFAMRPVFFASYRDIHDALISSKLRVSSEFMHEFLRTRGIVLSTHASREDLVDTIASFAYESADLDELCDQLEIHSKADRVSSKAFNAVVSAEDVNTALASIKTAHAGRIEKIDFDHAEAGRIVVSVDYYEIQENRTALRQHLPKHGKIEFLKVGDGMRVRFPGAERVSELASEILTELEKKHGKLEVFQIDLSAFNKLQRTEFFQLMITKLNGYKVSDVKKVNLNREIYSPDFSSGEEGTEEELTESDADDSPSVEEVGQKSIEKEVKAVLKRAMLDGSGILHASELRRFLDSGFFISRIVWEVQPRSKKDGKPKAELEAILEKPAEGLGFKYNVRGVYSQKSDKTYATTKRRPKDVEREALLDNIETAAQAAYAEIVAKSSTE